jgi:hypothetical protein
MLYNEPDPFIFSHAFPTESVILLVTSEASFTIFVTSSTDLIFNSLLVVMLISLLALKVEDKIFVLSPSDEDNKKFIF